MSFKPMQISRYAGLGSTQSKPQLRGADITASSQKLCKLAEPCFRSLAALYFQTKSLISEGSDGIKFSEIKQVRTTNGIAHSVRILCDVC